jgi:uncharacterized protein DUF3617
MRFTAMSSLLAMVLLSAGAYAAAPDMRDGLWEITMKMDMPGMPAGMPPQIVKQCYTRKDVENPQRLAPQGGPGTDRCQMSNYQIKGNTASWNWSCKGTEEMSGNGTMTFSGTSYTGTTKMSMKNGGQTQNMTMQYSGRRVGDCK